MEQAGHQGRAEDVAHLLAAHARRERLDLLARNKVALHHIHLVRRHDAGQAIAGTVQTAATSHGSQAGTDEQGHTQTGAAMGFDGHGKGS